MYVYTKKGSCSRLKSAACSRFEGCFLERPYSRRVHPEGLWRVMCPPSSDPTSACVCGQASRSARACRRSSWVTWDGSRSSSGSGGRRMRRAAGSSIGTRSWMWCISWYVEVCLRGGRGDGSVGVRIWRRARRGGEGPKREGGEREQATL